MPIAARLNILAFVLVALAFPATAVEWGPVANYASANEQLNINGRFVNLKTGGVGLRASESLLSRHLTLDVAALYGYTGSADATFSSADVSGPARLTTLKADFLVFWSPESAASLYTRMGYVDQRGYSDFTGSRNGSPVSGHAQLQLRNRDVALGLRVSVTDAVVLFGETGRHDWRLKSDASGTVGAIRSKTQIEASHQDPLLRLGLEMKQSNWRATLSIGQYQMTADNKTRTQSLEGAVMYAF